MADAPQSGTYEVVWPRGRRTAENIVCAPRLNTLEGKTVCELSNQIFRSKEIFPLVERELAKRYPGVKFASHDVFDSAHGREANVTSALPGMLRESGCDAVISGVGC